MHLGKMARIIENETINGKGAYGLLEMMRDMRRGIWSETRNGRKIDTYRRNLQKAHIDRLEYLMTAEKPEKTAYIWRLPKIHCRKYQSIGHPFRSAGRIEQS